MDLGLRATAVIKASASSGHRSRFAESAFFVNEATVSSGHGSIFACNCCE
jgi:hypothetical protein